MNITAYQLASRYVGLKEISGSVHNPAIVAMHQLDHKWIKDDETPWCSSFVNWIAWHLRLPRSKKASARSWLSVGTPINIEDAEVGWDVVVLWRGSPSSWTGHVGFYAGHGDGYIKILGGNQGNSVSIEDYPDYRLLSVQRLYS